MSAPVPALWLNGRALDSTASSSAPVLAGLAMPWGADQATEQPKAGTLSFAVLFRDGMHDVPDLNNGAKVELRAGGLTLFAGLVRTMAAAAGPVAGSLLVSATATDYTAELENVFVQIDWPAETGEARAARLVALFKTRGWTLQLPAGAYDTAAARYVSIKLLTMLDRHISIYRGRRFDTSYRSSGGSLVKRLTVAHGTARELTPDTLAPAAGGVWDRTPNLPRVQGLPDTLAPSLLQRPELWTFSGGMGIVDSSLGAEGKRFDWAGSGGTGWAYGPYVPVTVGEKLYAEATSWKSGTFAGNAYLRIYWYTATKAGLPGPYAAAPQTGTSPSGTKYVIPAAVVPPGAVYARVVMALNVSTTGSAGFYDVIGRRLDGEPGRLVNVPASNVERDVEWTQDPDNAITAVRLSRMVAGDDGYTELTESDITADAALVEKFGLYRVEVETDAAETAGKLAVTGAMLSAWQTSDAPWKPSDLVIRDSTELTQTDLEQLLQPAARAGALLVVPGAMPNRPDPGTSTIRSYLMGGSIGWDGKRWRLGMNLERTITPHLDPASLWTFEKIADSLDPNVFNARLDTIGATLTIADFAEIATWTPAGALWTFTDLAADPALAQLALADSNPTLSFTDFATIRRN